MVYMEDFDRAWRLLAEQGRCDGIDGEEYCRVRQEWLDAGCPSDLFEFIPKAANRMPGDSGWTE